MRQLRKEQSYQQGGNVDDNQICKLGKQYGANLVCVVKISHSMGSKYIDVRLLEVETAEIKRTASDFNQLKRQSSAVGAANNIIFQLLDIKPSVPTQWLIGYRASLTSPYGLSLGVSKQFGGYAQVRLNMPEVSERNLITNVYEGEGSRKYFRRSYTGGAMWRVQDWLFLYGGAGYGQYGATYVSGNKYYCPDLVSGLELECGATFAVWHITASVGYSAIPNFQLGKVQFGEIHFGLGVRF
jgi:hypothetical protein